MSESTQRISVREKVGYSLGDIATNFFFQSMILFQTRFYTDTVGISAAAVGTMFLVLRLADACADPIIGALADRTQTRWGKFRPWILWTAIPFGLIFWAVYVTPNVGPHGKLVYAYITYVLVMVLYSANNTPYSALMGVMSPNASERSSIASYRFVAALIGQFAIQALALPLVDKFGQGNSQKGWAVTMAIFGCLIVVFNLVVFATTRERVVPNPEQKPSLGEDIKNVFTCKPWVIMFVFTLLMFTTLVVRGTGLNYFFSYYMDPTVVRDFLDGVGLGPSTSGGSSVWKTALDQLGLLVRPDGSNAASVGLSFFMVLGSIIQIFGIICSKPLADRFGSKTVYIVGLTITTFATAAVFFVPSNSMTLMVILSVIWPLAYGPTVPLTWLMIADVADYSEWKTSRRATGFMYAGVLFALKAGLGLGGALSGWLLAAYGYVPNVAQSEHALLGIRLTATVYSAIPFALGIICLCLYPIGKKLNQQIGAELAERRKKFAATASPAA